MVSIMAAFSHFIPRSLKVRDFSGYSKEIATNL
jgi:hypothetical protein